VDFLASEAIKVVEHHRRQRRAEFHHLGRWLIKFPALVVRADDENAQVEPVRGFIAARFRSFTKYQWMFK